MSLNPYACRRFFDWEFIFSNVFMAVGAFPEGNFCGKSFCGGDSWVPMLFTAEGKDALLVAVRAGTNAGGIFWLCGAVRLQ